VIRRGLRDQVAQALGRLDRGVAHHHRHPARVRAEIDRRDAGVAGDDAHIERIDAEHLCDDGGEHVVRPLPDLGRAAEHRDLPAAVEQQLHPRLRHLVPVDRQTRAAQIRAAGDPHAAPSGELAMLVLPVRAHHHLADAFGEADRADLEPVRRERVRFGDDIQTEVRGILPELLRYFVELHFLPETRLRRAVAALGAARRLVREHPGGVELVARDLVGDRLQHAGVESARSAVAAVGTAVEQRLGVHTGDLPVFVTPVAFSSSPDAVRGA
jgi:hypothetical protein